MSTSRSKTQMRLGAILLAAALVAQTPGGWSRTSSAIAAAGDQPSAAAADSSASAAAAFGTSPDTFEPYYADVLAGWLAAGHKPTEAAPIRLPGAAFSAQSSGGLASAAAYQGREQTLLWPGGGESWVEYTAAVPQDGLYELRLDYHPYTPDAKTTAGSSASANRRPITLAVTVDGTHPYREARSLPLHRWFRDELPVKQDADGDDIRPKSVVLDDWRTMALQDAYAAYDAPLLWHLTAGTHTIRLAGSQPVAIASLTIAPPTPVPAYAEAHAAMPDANAAAADSVLTLQAEALSAKNDVAVQMAVDKDALTAPRSLRRETFNTVGGARWATGGQTIAWTFSVPESGRYKIAMRALQNTQSNKTSHRRIELDGRVPYRELNAYPFPYSSGWKGVTLQDQAGEPYVFYLEEGEHTLSMTATLSPFQPAIVESERVAARIREVSADLKAMTGSVVDKNRTWKADRDYPALPAKLAAVRDDLQRLADLLLQANGKRDSMLQLAETAVRDIEGYLRYPDEIPYVAEDIAAIQEKIGSLRETLVKNGLQLDVIHIVPIEADPPAMEAGFFRKLRASAERFMQSFLTKDNLSDLDGEALNVWVNRGRDYVNLLQELSDQSFTPETGIRVKVNLLPDQNLLIYANVAGLSPDVALGQPQDKSIDFAMRNALADLGQFPDFEQVASQFSPGALLPFHYNGGTYALPETQSFQVLFYRKDILKQLGLSVPDTWQDVYDMLPTLQQNGYNFHFPAADFIPFFYQNGAEFFSPDGMRSALGTPEAFQAFRQWTDLFNIYDLEKAVPSFYQHFRKGTMPIGVADYNTYVTLSVAAPELAGWWGIAPLPGIKQPDGTVARWSAGGQTTGFIYKSSTKQQEAWAFLRWLVSAETQARYGMDLESFYGIGFRWNTANVEAFSRLPWPKEDLNVILEQWRWFKEMPNLPGSYFVPRELTNAWSRTVVSGMNNRESLEEALVNIDREMVRKEQEFGFVATDGTVLHTLPWPAVDKPWEGVAPYAAK